DQGGRPGFRRVLLAVADSYRNKRADLERAANSLADAVAQAETFNGARAKFDLSVVDAQMQSITKLFDIRNGGFGQSPKFPHASAIELVLERYQETKEKHLLAMAETTLEKMARGGVYDQLAGGFHRYSVDERWLVPHFEKMSYDNSELLKNYLHGWQVTQNPFLRETAEGIIGWVNELLSDQRGGGFYASQDADYCLSDDGDYFTWTLEEVREVVLPAEAQIIELYYDVEARGEMHHNPAKNVLWVAREPAAIAKTLGGDETAVRLTIARARDKMLAGRLRRITPYIDTTMYVSWNAMFVSAYLEAARILGRSIGDNCRDFALKTIDRMLNEAWTEDKGFAHRIGGPHLEGSLDDQVFSVVALLDAYETTLHPRYFHAAQQTMDYLLENYADTEGGGFFDRSRKAAPLAGLDVRRKPFQDSPTPGANSVAIMALVRMHVFTGDERYYNFAQKTLEAFAGIAPQYGLFAGTYGLAALMFSGHPVQVVITGRADDPAARSLEVAANRVYRLGKSVLRFTGATGDDTAMENLPEALKETLPHLQGDKAVAIVCVGQSCLPPTADPTQLIALLENGASGAVGRS
ncbi:MAG TPA: hypothetical protein VFR42_04405, partial [Candidatus Acidoferrum sp.]|nr:hypothetical protein [Candidatus Acidoferrum sp.]